MMRLRFLKYTWKYDGLWYELELDRMRVAQNTKFSSKSSQRLTFVHIYKTDL